MEALALALLIVRNAYRKQETVGPEPHEFQPFDVQALRHSYYSEENGPSRPSDRQKSYVPRAAT
jgi:hypothetical protein